MIQTETITSATPRHNRRVPLAISLWLNPVFRPIATQTPITYSTFSPIPLLSTETRDANESTDSIHGKRHNF